MSDPVPEPGVPPTPAPPTPDVPDPVPGSPPVPDPTPAVVTARRRPRRRPAPTFTQRLLVLE